MQRLIFFALVALSTDTETFAQGTVGFANGQRAAVYLDFVGGQKVPRGSAFQAELMFALDGTPEDAFDSVAIRLGAPTIFNAPADGSFDGGIRIAPTGTPGGFGIFQVRVWESIYGTSYRSTVDSGNPQARVGTSTIFRADTGDETSIPPQPPPQPPTVLFNNGLTSFALSPLGGSVSVPEPSTCALGVLGVSALWLLRRRKT